MDDQETLHRRARLRELIQERFDGKDANLLRYVEDRTGKKPNQGELSGLQKDNSGRSFGDVKARNLTKQIGLHRRWFDMPLGACLNRSDWMSDYQPLTTEQNISDAGSRDAVWEAYSCADEVRRELVNAILGIESHLLPWINLSAVNFLIGITERAADEFLESCTKKKRRTA